MLLVLVLVPRVPVLLAGASVRLPLLTLLDVVVVERLGVLVLVLTPVARRTLVVVVPFVFDVVERVVLVPLLRRFVLLVLVAVVVGTSLMRVPLMPLVVLVRVVVAAGTDDVVVVAREPVELLLVVVVVVAREPVELLLVVVAPVREPVLELVDVAEVDVLLGVREPLEALELLVFTRELLELAVLLVPREAVLVVVVLFPLVVTTFCKSRVLRTVVVRPAALLAPELRLLNDWSGCACW